MEADTEAALLKSLYLKVWYNFLRFFLGWPTDQINRWAVKWEDGLNNKAYGGLFYHDTALSYVVPLLIPDRLRERLGFGEFNRLCERLETAIVERNSEFVLASTYDWEAAKHRVESILAEYEDGGRKGDGGKLGQATMD
jgi:hypothetical protein